MGILTFDEYLKLRKKKNDDIAPVASGPRNSGVISIEELLESRGVDYTVIPAKDDIIAQSSSDRVSTGGGAGKSFGESEEKERTWFDKGAFKDGYQFGDVTKTILGSTSDLGENILTGIAGMGEKAVDALAYLAPAMAMSQQAQSNPTFQYDIDEYRAMQKESADFIAKDWYDEEKVAKTVSKALLITPYGVDTENDSVFGEKTDSLAQSAGQLGATVALQAVGVPWYLTTGATSFGSEVENAFEQGATYNEAGISAAITTGSEILTEKIGGIFGGKAVDGKTKKLIAENIANKTARTITKLGVDASTEGFEEVLSGALSALGQKITYADEKEFNELFSSEDAFESFVGGFVLGGGVSGISAAKTTSEGIDYVTGLTENEQKVIDKEVENRISEQQKDGKELDRKAKNAIAEEVRKELERGGISIDTIESALGGDTFTAYNDLVNEANEFNTLNKTESGKLTGEQSDRLAELKEKNKTTPYETEISNLRERLSQEVDGITQKDTFLRESYNEKAKRGQSFEADLTKYDAKQAEIVKKAAESGILNNTRKTHEFVDLIAKLAADKGVSFDFTSNQKLKESGFALEGKTVNGFVKDGNITLNVNSAKALNTVVGHEITHVLEGTELYNELQDTIFKYAESKGEFQTRFDATKELYKGVYKDLDEADFDAKIRNELTSDLVGEYLFTDSDFINRLSTEKPNIFKKVYDEIKYMLKIATAGSQEAKELEKVKKIFEKAYKESASTDTNTKYSLEHTSEGVEYVKADKNMFLKENGEMASEREIFNSLVGKTLSFPEGDVKIVKRLPKKDIYNELSRRYPKYTKDVEDTKQLNSEVNYNMEELLSNSEAKTLNEPDVNNRHQAQGITSFDTRTVKFYDGNKAYDIEFSIATLQNGEKVAYAKKFFGYDEVLTKKIQTDEARSNKSPLNQQSDFNNSIPQNTNKSSGDVKFSLNADSNGQQLSKAQQEYFKDSKIRDDNGNLKVMYHGSPAQFTVFDKKKAKSSGYYGRGFYFSESESHAGQYGSKYEVYLNIKNPMQEGTNDITKEQLRKFVNAVAENEDYGIENYGYDATVDSVTNSVYGKDDFAMIMDINATSIGDMVEAIQLFNEINGTNYDGIIVPTETVAFYPEQIKSIVNEKPTSDPDIRFSLSETGKMVDDKGNEIELQASEVGTHGTLMAIRNINEGELRGMLSLGGIPVPSIAITDPSKVDHTAFGSISILFDKHTIDPANKKNEVYDRDIWSSRFPKLEYEADSKRARETYQKINELSENAPESVRRTLYRYSYDIEDVLNRNGGEAGLIDSLSDDYGMKQAYLFSKGEFVEDVIRQTETKLTDEQIKEYDILLSEISEEALNTFDAPNGVSPIARKKEWFAKYETEVKEAYKKYLSTTFPFSAEELSNITDSMRTNDFLKEVRAALTYQKNGPTTVKEEIDTAATRQEVENRVDVAEYRKWLKELFSGVQKSVGIYNGKDPFTPSGNRKSFRQLHDDFTLENLVKNMTKGRTQGSENAMFGVSAGAISANMATRYHSIKDIKKDESRLDASADEKIQPLKDKLGESIKALHTYYKGSSYNVFDSSTEAVFELSTKKLTEDNFRRILKDYNFDAESIPSEVLQEVISDLNALRNIPTDYFESKPQRAVGLDEVQAIVLPNNTDIELKRELSEKGFNVIEYDPNIAGDRQYKINQMDNLKFSLSVQKDDIAPIGNYNVYGKDIALETAPETVSKTEIVDDFAPMTEDMANERDAQQIPIDESYAPAEEEDFFDIFSGESKEEVADPFADRDIKSVGNRKVKAYMYENPEVKPFFQEEAQNMLYELKNSVKGEKHFNDQLYYDTNGEQGWFGTTRETSEDIAYFLDNFKYTYADIEKGLKAIIEDHGAENNAISKRIEFALNDRLKDGYTDFMSGMEIPANQDYVNLLTEKQIAAYSDEAYAQWAQSLVEVEPTEDIAPVADTVSEAPAEDIAPVMDGVQRKIDLETGEIVDEAEPEVRKTHGEIQRAYVDNIKQKFSDSGYDFDKVLESAKNKSTFASVDNTPQRFIEKTFGYKEGQILNELTINQEAQHETQAIKWLNSFTNRKDGELAKISKQYGIKPNSKEDAAAQMYAEGFYVNEKDEYVQYGDAELAKDFPDADTQARIKGLVNNPRIREIYDTTLSQINESRVRNGYPEIPRRDNYYLHFRAMDDTFSKLGIPFNPNDIRAKDLPTDINGMTADLKPGQPYFASANARRGIKTSHSLIGGMERYLTSAKNQIYHIDDIQILRGLRNYVADMYGQAHGLENLDTLTEEEAEARVKEVYDAHLSTFAKFLNEQANVLAGKTALVDRGLEGVIGRRGITFLDTVNRQVGSNMVGFNVSSSLTNFVSVVQAFAKSNKYDAIRAFAQMASNKISSIYGKSDGFAENNPAIIRRKGVEKLSRKPVEVITDAGYILMSTVDSISTEFITRAKYNELTRKGMDSQKAHYEADKWASRILGDRSLGQQPQLYNSKMLGLFTKFQLEVRNQLDSMYYDTIQETKVSNEDIENTLTRNAKTAAKVTATFFQLAVMQHLFGKAFETVAGYNPTFDIIGVLLQVFGFDDDEESEDTALDNIEQGFLSLMDDLPYTSVFTGGRIPISSALPIEQLVTGKDDYGNDKSRVETVLETAPYYVLPSGYGQYKKTKQGLGMFDEDLPVSGSYTDSGNLRFPVEDTPLNRAQAAVFGQWASGNARDYFDNERQPLKEKQIQEYKDLDIPIKDYWKYREGLKEQDTLEEKFDYIAGLDLPISKKNIMVNNIVDRKERVDLINYDDFANYEEFDFATKNPEKYAFLESINVSYKDYKASEEATTAYNWAFNNPEKYPVAKAAGGVIEYREYAKALDKLTADKDNAGKTISGSRKAKVLDYINGLSADYGAKIILYKTEYPSDSTYDMEILDYLNNRSDISYDETVAVLRELGFTVDADGTVRR